jgi:hypothetical protein
VFTRRASFLAVISVFLVGPALASESIPNWPAPAAWSPHSAGQGLTTMGDITSPLPFIGVTPCRQYDSRNTSALPQATAREVVVTGAPCGIPTSAKAVSLNVTVFDILGQTGNAVLQVGTTNNPTTAWINYPVGQGQIGNAGALPLSGAGSIFFRIQQGGGSIDFTIDVNGYYSDGALGALASGERFTLLGDVSGGTTGLLAVHNTETVSGARAGYFVADSSGLGSTGIGAIETATSGLTAGVYGQANSNTTNTAGVSGVATSTTGVVYGVYGQSNSDQARAAGVYGVDGSGPTSTGLGLTRSAGIKGDSANNFGVVGLSQVIAVYGILFNSGGSVGAGLLGYTPDSGTTKWGVYAFGNIGASGAKPFIEAHPTDAAKEIRYVALEGPEAGTYFRGRARFSHGLATIEVPESFRLVTDEVGLTVQITPIGEIAGYAVTRVGLDEIVVRGTKDVEFFYTVNGVRQTFRDWEVVSASNDYMPWSADARMPEAFSPEQKRRLIANGTYRPDGTVNMETAERLGWAKIWADRETQARAAAEANAAAHAAKTGERK